MPDDKKHKNKSEAKEQRKPRHGRHQPPVDRKDKDKVEKKVEEPRETKAPVKPVYEEPGPEFYKSLKRETDEILKITEEANSKYKKKEIQSNWSKYEMPIESYEEIEEQEHLGADYEKLIQTPLSIGGHFQFKHEKSWDVSTGPSLYDKYFEIDMDSLATALCTIPFYERNDIDKSLFSEIDISNMENRSVRYKQRYYNDKAFTSPELEAQDKILMHLAAKENDVKDKVSESTEILSDQEKDIVLEETKITTPTIVSSQENRLNEQSNIENTVNLTVKEVIEEKPEHKDDKIVNEIEEILLSSERKDSNQQEIDAVKLEIEPEIELPRPPKAIPAASKTESKKPVLESPEDLEKWLDDFLDG